jgi:hypothetical protein
MGFDLIDLKNRDDGYSTNFWNWHAIVEVIRSLHVLSDEKVDSLHEQFIETGLSAEEARIVAAEIRSRLLPKLGDQTRVCSDGSFFQTDLPDNGMNGVSSRSLQAFAAYCERSNGFVLS